MEIAKVSNQKNEIVINGKRYDARTGKLLGAVHEQEPLPDKRPKRGTVLDGVMKREAGKHRVARSSHTAKSVHGKPARSKTLMRTSVKTLGGQKSPAIHDKITPKLSVNQAAPQSDRLQTAHTIPHQRGMRAQSIAKSSLISRFGLLEGAKRAGANIVTAPLAVKAAPEQTTVPSVPRQEKNQLPTNSFEAAIETATAHRQKALKKPKAHHKLARKLQLSPRALGVASFAAAAILISGFVAYQNVPNVAVRVAAARSGVRAELPNYKPPGFKINGPIQYGAGEMSVQYKSNTDDRTFTITQRRSNWNSEALLENFVASSGDSYQMYQDKGRTIYLYDGSNATWVDSGVWYQVESESSLSQDQLLRIISSL